mmetsp:Transcript_7835/g.31443  ORF Transcript_7835/g.31443 Transcript_7835/m.31443 type:complete len:250 (+) Transcript_7835:477-1226(+)
MRSVARAGGTTFLIQYNDCSLIFIARLVVAIVARCIRAFELVEHGHEFFFGFVVDARAVVLGRLTFFKRQPRGISCGTINIDEKATFTLRRRFEQRTHFVPFVDDALQRLDGGDGELDGHRASICIIDSRRLRNVHEKHLRRRCDCHVSRHSRGPLTFTSLVQKLDVCSSDSHDGKVQLDSPWSATFVVVFTHQRQRLGEIVGIDKVGLIKCRLCNTGRRYPGPRVSESFHIVIVHLFVGIKLCLWWST